MDMQLDQLKLVHLICNSVNLNWYTKYVTGNPKDWSTRISIIFGVLWAIAFAIAILKIFLKINKCLFWTILYVEDLKVYRGL